jgi:hypothetical protein
MSAHPPPVSSTSGSSYEICRPPARVPGETTEQTLARYQEAFEHLADCLNAELRVRPESSLLSFLFLKVIIPFVAISAAISTFYSRMVGSAKPHFAYTEHGLALFHLILAIAVLGLWLQYRKHGESTRFARYDGSLRKRFGVLVPPGKETISRNSIVNRWIFASLAVGIVFIMPALFYLLRANTLEHLGGRFIIDTTGICRPTVAGYNPFEGSDTCAGSGVEYVEQVPVTAAVAAVGAEQGAQIGNAPATVDRSVLDSAEVRLDGTTALALYFIILLIGILVSMGRWWRQDRKRRAALEQVQPSSTPFNAN